MALVGVAASVANPAAATVIVEIPTVLSDVTVTPSKLSAVEAVPVSEPAD